jgi:hypothetical protein
MACLISHAIRHFLRQLPQLEIFLSLSLIANPAFRELGEFAGCNSCSDLSGKKLQRSDLFRQALSMKPRYFRLSGTLAMLPLFLSRFSGRPITNLDSTNLAGHPPLTVQLRTGPSPANVSSENCRSGPIAFAARSCNRWAKKSASRTNQPAYVRAHLRFATDGYWQ